MILHQDMSLEAYLELEKETGERYELMDGAPRLVPSVTLEHDRIFKNLIIAMYKHLEAKGCTLVSGQMKLHTPACKKAFLYPDIHIYCGEIQQEAMPQGAYALVNPSFIIEVLSKDTRNYDRGDKFECYRKIPTLQAYLMIESQLDTHEPAIYLRTWEHDRQFQEKTLRLEDTLDILGCTLIGKDLYEGVKQ